MDTHEYTFAGSGDLAERIRTYRLRRGITQRALADELGVTQQSVARWEQGSPPRRFLLRVIESMLDDRPPASGPEDLADIIGIRRPAETSDPAPVRALESRRQAYVKGCLTLLERGERLPDRVLLLLADELGWPGEDG